MKRPSLTHYLDSILVMVSAVSIASAIIIKLSSAEGLIGPILLSIFLVPIITASIIVVLDLSELKEHHKATLRRHLKWIRMVELIDILLVSIAFLLTSLFMYSEGEIIQMIPFYMSVFGFIFSIAGIAVYALTYDVKVT